MPKQTINMKEAQDYSEQILSQFDENDVDPATGFFSLCLCVLVTGKLIGGGEYSAPTVADVQELIDFVQRDKPSRADLAYELAVMKKLEDAVDRYRVHGSDADLSDLEDLMPRKSDD